jgi:hypothetical protein
MAHEGVVGDCSCLASPAQAFAVFALRLPVKGAVLVAVLGEGEFVVGLEGAVGPEVGIAVGVYG